jgi:hypothetical protein
MIWAALELADSTLPSDTAFKKSTSLHNTFLHCADKRCSGVDFLLALGIVGNPFCRNLMPSGARKRSAKHCCSSLMSGETD